MTDLNYLAVILAAFAAFAVGALWYGLFFAKQWKALMGFSEEVMRSMKMTPTKSMIGGFLATLVLTYVLANFLSGITSLHAALVITLWIWVGFIATILLNAVLYENRSWKLYAINASHYFFALLVATLVLFYWP